MIIEFEILGEPKALKRHRTFTRDRNGKPLPYPVKVDPSAKDKQEFGIVAQLKAPPVLLDCPIELVVDFFFGRPRSHYRTGKYAGQLKDNPPIFHISRPDTDNLIKFVCDSLTGIFWKDDTRIFKITAQKLYSGKPRTYVKIIY